MAEAVLLLLPFRFGPVQVTAQAGGQVGRIQEDENIRIGQAFPHILDVGMFLGDVAGAIAKASQTGNQGGFPRAAGSDHPDEGVGRTGRFIIRSIRCHADLGSGKTEPLLQHINRQPDRHAADRIAATFQHLEHHHADIIRRAAIIQGDGFAQEGIRNGLGGRILLFQHGLQ